jgi:hypothetical protein
MLERRFTWSAEAQMGHIATTYGFCTIQLNKIKHLEKQFFRANIICFLHIVVSYIRDEVKGVWESKHKNPIA